MELATLRANGKRRGYRVLIFVLRWVIRILHYKTLGRTGVAIGRGYSKIGKASHRYTTAKDRDDVRAGTIKGAEKHLALSQRRTAMYWSVVLAGIFGFGYVIGHTPLWLPVPFTGTRISVMAVLILFGVGICAPFWIGRSGTVLAPPPRIGKLASEWLLIVSLNQMVMDAKEWKAFQETGPAAPITCRCVEPVQQLKNGKGYKTRMSLAGGRKAATVLDRTDDLAGLLGTDESQVFLSRVKGNENLVDLLVLYKDPWAESAPVNPLVIGPRTLDLWEEDALIALRPTGDPFTRRLLRKGDGSSAATASIPRMGKTVLLANIAIAVAMDPYCIPLFLDLKGLDFKPLSKLCPEWGYQGRPKLQAARAFLKRVVTIIDERNDLLEERGLVNANRELSHAEMPALFIFVDELAELLDSSDRIPEKIRKELVSLLSTIGRLGPTVAVNIFAATQRINERSMPPGFRDLLPNRYALNCANATASRMILGQGGESNRPDRLTDDDKGIAITERSDVIRTFYVDTEGDDLRRVAEYGYRIRREAGTLHWIEGDDLGGLDTGSQRPPGDSDDGDSTGGLMAASTAPARVQIVDTALELMDTLGYGRAIPTSRVLRHVNDQPGAVQITDVELAAKLSRHGVRSSQVWFRNSDGQRQKYRSYLRDDLEAVAGPLPVNGISTPVRASGTPNGGPGAQSRVAPGGE